MIFDHVDKGEILPPNRFNSNPETQLSYDTLIIASGSTSNKFGWPGQDLQGVQGLYSYNDLLH